MGGCGVREQAQITPGRARDVREFHEAWWSTGHQNPANYIPATPPISPAEEVQFAAFHRTQTGFYACLLVGEIVGACMAHSKTGLIDPRVLLAVDHLVVDEYQDLNPMDLAFVDQLISLGVATFVAGDDDQSVYSFRHASPQGIQSFLQRHGSATSHILSDCFRCTPEPLLAAQNLLAGFSPSQRIAKHQVSLYATGSPPVQGHVALWRFNSVQPEADAIADSCLSLHSAGLDLGSIMILLGNARAMAGPIQAALDAKGVAHSPVRTEPFRDSDPGRTAFSILRILADKDDVVACRNLVSLQQGMGPHRCLDLTARCVSANISAIDLFYGHIPPGTLTPMPQAKVQVVRTIAATLQGWTPNETFAQRGADLAQLVEQVRNPGDRHEWELFAQSLPQDATLQEVADLLFADNLEEEHAVLASIHDRLGLPQLPEVDADRVQVMTMHGSKGLSAKVVFIPGLEESVFPTQRRAAAPGLIEEGARLLYVSLTRARAAAICSFTMGRLQNGSFAQNAPSRYLAPLGIGVQHRTGGMTTSEAQQVATTAAALECGQDPDASTPGSHDCATYCSRSSFSLEPPRRGTRQACHPS